MEGPLLNKNEHTVDIATGGSSPPLLDHQTQYINVESSDPYKTERFWNPFEFVLNVVQVVAIIIVLIQPKDEEHPQTLLSIWIIGYTCGCIASLPIICWRFWFYSRGVSSESTEEHSRGTRVNDVMDILQLLLEGFFVAWFVVFIWNLMINVSSLDDTTTQFFWLMMALLIYSGIRYVFVNITFAVICYLSPGLLCYFAIEEVLKCIRGFIGKCYACICG